MPTSLSAPFPLPPPAGGRADLLIIAGEHSGDEHAARLARELRARQPALQICALGGPGLAAAGAQLLHDLTASAVVGLVEVLKNYRYFRALFGATLDWIGRHRPRAVCFVDYPGFNLRLARALHARRLSAKGGGAIRALYYISPQIWAWRKGRRFDMAKHLDALAVIFPFETQCYADTSLPVEFVGHPFVAEDYEPPVDYDPGGPVLLLPGSRRQAVTRIFSRLLAGYEMFRRRGGNRRAVVIHPSDEVATVLRRELARWPQLAGRVDLRENAGAASAAAVLTSSGTMSLHCALAGIPGAIAYRANPLTYLLGRQLVQVPYLGIANLLLGEPMYPEFIQGAARADNLARELEACLDDPARPARTRDQARRLREILSRPASLTAAGWLANNLQ